MADLLGGLSVPDQAFWIVCALFYAADNIRLLDRRELIMVERLGRPWMPLFPLTGYRLAGRPVCLLNLLLPTHGAVRMAWLCADGFASPRLRHAARLLRLTARRLDPFRPLAVVTFLAWFVVGPFATDRWGLAAALAIVLPVHVASLAWLAVAAVVMRRPWRMAWSDLAVLWFECAVCPGVLVNVCRRLALRFARIPGDGLAYAIAMGDERDRLQLGARLPHALDDIAGHDAWPLRDEPAVAAYRRRTGADDG